MCDLEGHPRASILWGGGGFGVGWGAESAEVLGEVGDEVDACRHTEFHTTAAAHQYPQSFHSPILSSSGKGNEHSSLALVTVCLTLLAQS